jgi:DNA anti-recombination protein RmuC
LTGTAEIPNKSCRTVLNIFKKHRINRNADNFADKFQELIDSFKQKIATMGKRLRRYNQSNKRKQQNRQFSLNQKQLHNSLNEKTSSGPTSNKTAIENH